LANPSNNPFVNLLDVPPILWNLFTPMYGLHLFHPLVDANIMSFLLMIIAGLLGYILN
jgi:hypothetical protein